LINRIFPGYVICRLPKLGEMLRGVKVDVRAKFGPLSTLELTLRRGQNIFVFGG